MKNIAWGFLLSLQFLTRLPIPVQCPWNRQTMKWALRCYPLVGLLIGGLLGALSLWLHAFLPLWFLSLILISVWVWFTGGLHLDGWMDVADAVGSNAPLDKKWQIMKDPHVGSFGIISLNFLLLWKLALIYFLLEQFVNESSSVAIIYIISIPLLARFGSVVIMYFVPAVKEEGLAWEWRKHLTLVDVFLASPPLIAFLFFFPVTLPLFLVYGVFLGGYAWWAYRTFKGINGDLIGTVIEGGELWGLVIAWIYIWFVMG
jgi:adenosylcobinamide-GDP ribazoletransferase